MKTKYFLLSITFLFIAFFSFAAIKNDTLKVSGICSECKGHIETAARTAGAATAYWNKDTKLLVVKYDDTKTSLFAIEKQIAAAGYDTPDIKATNAAYKSLDECCQYDRQ